MGVPEYHNILVRGVDTIGTFVLATPFYRELRRNFPLSKITLCVKPLVYDLAAGCPYIDELLIYDKKKYGGEFGFIRELRNRNFDCAFVLSGSFHSALVCFLAGIKTRIGYPHDHRGWLLTHKVFEPVNSRKHCVEYLLDILVSVGCKVTNSGEAAPELWFDEEDSKIGKEILKANGVDFAKTLVGISFGVAGEGARKWPINNWIELIRRIIARENVQVVLFGTKQDMIEGEQILKSIPIENSVVNMCGKTTLREFAGCVMKNFSLFVGVATGGLHIASALGVPSIGVYVSGDKERWSPRGKKVSVIESSALVPCAPCNQSKMRHCRDNVCMKSISVEEVFGEVRKFL